MPCNAAIRHPPTPKPPAPGTPAPHTVKSNSLSVYQLALAPGEVAVLERLPCTVTGAGGAEFRDLVKEGATVSWFLAPTLRLGRSN